MKVINLVYAIFKVNVLTPDLAYLIELSFHSPNEPNFDDQPFFHTHS